MKCKAGKRDEAFFRKEVPLSYRILRTTILIKHMYILLLITHEAFLAPAANYQAKHTASLN
jgi:hypothetical protein